MCNSPLERFSHAKLVKFTQLVGPLTVLPVTVWKIAQENRVGKGAAIFTT